MAELVVDRVSRLVGRGVDLAPVTLQALHQAACAVAVEVDPGEDLARAVDALLDAHVRRLHDRPAQVAHHIGVCPAGLVPLGESVVRQVDVAPLDRLTVQAQLLQLGAVVHQGALVPFDVVDDPQLRGDLLRQDDGHGVVEAQVE